MNIFLFSHALLCYLHLVTLGIHSHVCLPPWQCFRSHVTSISVTTWPCTMSGMLQLLKKHRRMKTILHGGSEKSTLSLLSTIDTVLLRVPKATHCLPIGIQPVNSTKYCAFWWYPRRKQHHSFPLGSFEECFCRSTSLATRAEDGVLYLRF